MPRRCACPHGFPLCACHERLTGDALLARSRWLSSLAGWPGRLDPEMAAEHERAVACAATSASPSAPPPSLVDTHRHRVDAVRACSHWTAEGCGCSAGRCLAGKGQLGTGLVSFAECFECLGV